MKSKVAYDVRGYLDLDDDTIEYITLQVPYVVMSNSNYIVNGYNNTLAMTIGANNYLYTIPQGNYTAATFRVAVLALLPGGFTMTYDLTTNKFTFTYSAAFSLNQGSGCDYIIGFSGTETASLSGAIYTLTCSRAFNFLPIPRYLMHCNILNDGISLGVNSALAAGDILASIPNNSKPNGQIVYENIASEFVVQLRNVGQIVITITDDNNREIDFLGVSSYFMLKFNIFRRMIKRPMKFDDLVLHANQINLDELQIQEDEAEEKKDEE